MERRSTLVLCQVHSGVSRFQDPGPWSAFVALGSGLLHPTPSLWTDLISPPAPCWTTFARGTVTRTDHVLGVVGGRPTFIPYLPHARPHATYYHSFLLWCFAWLRCHSVGCMGAEKCPKEWKMESLWGFYCVCSTDLDLTRKFTVGWVLQT